MKHVSSIFRNKNIYFKDKFLETNLFLETENSLKCPTSYIKRIHFIKLYYVQSFHFYTMPKLHMKYITSKSIREPNRHRL